MTPNHPGKPRLFEVPKTQAWRVTLCRLESDIWHEHGFGRAWCERNEKDDETWLLVESERGAGEMLMRCRIQAPLSFRKQDTLLFCAAPRDRITIFSDSNKAAASDGPGPSLVRMAIGFQDLAACVSVCDFLIYAASTWAPGVTVAVQYATENDSEIDLDVITEPLDLPPLPRSDNAVAAVRSISRLLRTPIGREFLAIYLDKVRYLDHMYDLFTQTEMAASSPVEPASRIRILWALSDIMKQYFLVGDGMLIDNMVSSDQFTKVISILEYDRTFGTRKANFRDYYCNHTELKQVVKIDDMPVLEKIRRTFRLQLLRDILVRSADDFPFQILKTLIYINQVEIIDSLQNSTTFCDDLFGLFDEEDETAGSPAREDSQVQAIKFLNEVIKISRTFTMNQMRILYETLTEYGLFETLNQAMAADNPLELKILVLESLGVLLDFDSGLAAGNLKVTIETLTQIICKPRDPSGKTAADVACTLQVQASELLKRLLAEEPKLTATTFFSNAARFLAKEKEQVSGESIEFILDIVSYSYARAPAHTIELSIGHSLWPELASTRLIRTGVDRRTDAGVLVALVRAMQDAIQPVYADDIDKVIVQARELIDTGLIGKTVEILVSLQNVNNMVYSSCLNLVQMVVAGLMRGEPQFCVVANWMATQKRADVEKLSKKFAAFKEILVSASHERLLFDDAGSNETETEAPATPDFRERPATRKRSTSSEYFAGRVNSMSKSPRPRASQISHAHHPVVDEVDTQREADGWPSTFAGAASPTLVDEHSSRNSFSNASEFFGTGGGELEASHFDDEPDSNGHHYWNYPSVQQGITSGGQFSTNVVLLHRSVSGGPTEPRDPDFP